MNQWLRMFGWFYGQCWTDKFYFSCKNFSPNLKGVTCSVECSCFSLLWVWHQKWFLNVVLIPLRCIWNPWGVQKESRWWYSVSPGSKGDNLSECSGKLCHFLLGFSPYYGRIKPADGNCYHFCPRRKAWLTIYLQNNSIMKFGPH